MFTYLLNFEKSRRIDVKELLLPILIPPRIVGFAPFDFPDKPIWKAAFVLGLAKVRDLTNFAFSFHPDLHLMKNKMRA